MTRPDSSASPNPTGNHRPGGLPRPPDTDPRAGGRRVAAAVVAMVTGGFAFCVLLLLGLLLYARVYGNSAPALTVIGAVFGAAGLYAGWLAAMMVFSAMAGERRGR